MLAAREDMIARPPHVLLFVVTVGLAGGCAKDSSAPAASTASAAEQIAGLTRIKDPTLVWMVNDT